MRKHRLKNDLEMHKQTVSVFGHLLDISDNFLKLLNIFHNKYVIANNDNVSFIIDDYIYVFEDMKEMYNYINNKLNIIRKKKLNKIIK
jgi:hypothetical protein